MMKVIHSLICIVILDFALVAAGAPVGEAQGQSGKAFVGETYIIDYPQPVDKSIDKSPAGIRKLTRAKATSRGYTDREWQCLDLIIQRESKYRLTAVNGSHYGIGQVRGMKHGTGAQRQIQRVLDYIEHRYGTACKAYAFHKKHRWY
jgi:hypothetical protein